MFLLFIYRLQFATAIDLVISCRRFNVGEVPWIFRRYDRTMALSVVRALIDYYGVVAYLATALLKLLNDWNKVSNFSR